MSVRLETFATLAGDNGGGEGFVYGLYLCLCMLGIVGVSGFPLADRVIRLPGQPKVKFQQYEAEKPLTLWLNGCTDRLTLYYALGRANYARDVHLSVKAPSPSRDLSIRLGTGEALEESQCHGTELYHYFVKTVCPNTASNLLLVESPARVGWSYSNTTSAYNCGDHSTVRDMDAFLTGWLDKFPCFKIRSLFLTGESYAEHYIPHLAVSLLDHNAVSTVFKFNLSGIAGPLSQDYSTRYDYYWAHGMISDELSLEIKEKCGFHGYTFSEDVTCSCKEVTQKAQYIARFFIDPCDVILEVCNPASARQKMKLREPITKISIGVDACMGEERSFYFNMPEVQSALHANKLPYPWSNCRGKYLKYNDADRFTDVLPLLKRIILADIPVFIYSGDQDSIIPLVSTRSLIRELALNLRFQITDPYGEWFLNDQVGGWVTEYGNLLTFATVRGAGHMVPFTQAARSLQLFGSFVQAQRLPDMTTVRMDVR